MRFKFLLPVAMLSALAAIAPAGGFLLPAAIADQGDRAAGHFALDAHSR